MKLILDLSRLLERPVMINSKDAFRQIGVEEESAVPRGEKRARVCPAAKKAERPL